MSQLAKILVTVVIIIVALALFAVVVGSREANGAHTPGILGLIIFAGAIGAVKAIWKKNRVE